MSQGKNSLHMGVFQLAVSLSTTPLFFFRTLRVTPSLKRFLKIVSSIFKAEILCMSIDLSFGGALLLVSDWKCYGVKSKRHFDLIFFTHKYLLTYLLNYLLNYFYEGYIIVKKRTWKIPSYFIDLKMKVFALQ